MKKLVILIMLLLFAMPIAFAANGAGSGSSGGNSVSNSGESTKLTVQERTEFKESLGDEQSKVKGLENAMLRVRNEEVKMHLEGVMNKIQEKHRERLGELEGVVFEEMPDGEFKASFKKEARFLGFLKFKKNFNYELAEDGSLTYQKGPWDFLFSPEDLDPLEVESETA